jgi:tetratricopeptide (TPR) repeat protein
MMGFEAESEEFKKGKRLLGEEKIDRALRAFEKAYKADKQNPLYMSYYGMCRAMRGGQIGLGLDLCTRAIKKEFRRAEFYLNLGRVYLAAGNRKGATRVFKKGLQFEPDNPELHKFLAGLGVRNSSVIHGLERSNPLNKMLGMLFRRKMQKP